MRMIQRPYMISTALSTLTPIEEAPQQQLQWEIKFDRDFVGLSKAVIRVSEEISKSTRITIKAITTLGS